MNKIMSKKCLSLSKPSKTAVYSLCYGASFKSARKSFDKANPRMRGRARAKLFKDLTQYLYAR